MKVLMSTKSGKEQLKLTLTDAISDELGRLAIKHGKRSPQEIIYELIDFYLPVWRNVDTHLKQAVARQLQNVVAENLNPLSAQASNLKLNTVVKQKNSKGAMTNEQGKDQIRKTG